MSEDLIDYNNPVDYKNLADYANLVIQKVAVEAMIVLIAGGIAASYKKFGLIILLIH